MRHILCYGDSNTWGHKPLPPPAARFEFHQRWPGVMQYELGADYRVHENALNGRTTVFDDPIEEGRCGKAGFIGVLESASPLDLVIIMLGTNDCKLRFGLEPWDIGWGMDLLVQYVRRAKCGRDYGEPRILIVAPPRMGKNWGGNLSGTVFGPLAAKRAEGLAAVYREVARLAGVDFFDAAEIAEVGADCVHLTEESQKKLGLAITAKVREILQ